MFADIALRRRELEARRIQLERPPAIRPMSRRKANLDAKDLRIVAQAMEQAWRVLTSPDVAGHVKRDLLLTLIEKVVCQKDGAEVVFLPGVFGKAGEAESTLYTTCIGIRTQR